MNTTLSVRSVSVALWVLLLACDDDPDPVGEVKAAETSADAGAACDAAGCTPPTPPTLGGFASVATGRPKTPS